MQLQIFIFIAFLSFAVYAVSLVRKRQLAFKFSVIWIGILVFALLLVLSESVAKEISSSLGFVQLSNFVFFVALLALALLTLQLSVAITSIESRIEKISRHIALDSAVSPDKTSNLD